MRLLLSQVPYTAAEIGRCVVRHVTVHLTSAEGRCEGRCGRDLIVAEGDNEGRFLIFFIRGIKFGAKKTLKMYRPRILRIFPQN